MITAKVIADSISPAGKRITSLQLHYPKFIHGEFMTHRVFSRNASSSRAIPFEKMLKDIEEDMAMPVRWGLNQPGMQARDELNDSLVRGQCHIIWKRAFEDAKRNATELYALGLHKQIVNRILEPFYNINTLVTATEWANFFELRLHPDAQPEMHELARCMKEAMDASTPEELDYGNWHLPYKTVDDTVVVAQSLDIPNKIITSDWEDKIINQLIKVSVARCARVSYLTHEGKAPSIEDDLKLYDRLVGSVPLHASPAEHQATPDTPYEKWSCSPWEWENHRLHGNFVGWKQYRKMLERGLDI